MVSLGVNHADETNLKYSHNHAVWQQRYGAREEWIRRGVAADLRDWGFNTIGWTQDWVSGAPGAGRRSAATVDLGLSRQWAPADFRSAGMPYCMALRVAEIEEWNGYPVFPDVYSAEFEAYCEYLARSVCLDQAEDPLLLGWFLVDAPAWLPHPSGEDFTVLAGTSPRARSIKLYDVAFKYYETVTKHIRRVDPHHLVLGDRFLGNRGIPPAVLTAARRFVDVLSVDYRPDTDAPCGAAMGKRLRAWHEQSGLPVLLADVGGTSTDDSVEAVASIAAEPWLVGWHWSGYHVNGIRNWGLKDAQDEPRADVLRAVRALTARTGGINTTATGV